MLPSKISLASYSFWCLSRLRFYGGYGLAAGADKHAESALVVYTASSCGQFYRSGGVGDHLLHACPAVLCFVLILGVS